MFFESARRIPPRVVAVRPDTLTEGEASEYQAHDEVVAGLFRPDQPRMANVGHFMCQLATDEATWQRWRGRPPVIIDAVPGGRPA